MPNTNSELKGDFNLYHDLIIIGGGACGIAAAIKAKDLGIDVAIIDGNDRIGKKLLTTGNGRCNITNNQLSANRFHSDNSSFFKNILEKFNLNHTLNFFNYLGIYTVVLDENKIYPMSLQASSVIDILRINLEDRNIPIYLNSKVTNISKEKNFKVICNTKDVFQCKNLLLCTGGKSYTKTGSDGSGYKLAKSLGHTIINPSPGLVQLKLEYNRLNAISGVKFEGTCKILVNNVFQKEESGEILFTDYGISGPPILQLSRIASKGILNNNEVSLKISLITLPYNEMVDFLENHFEMFSYRSIYTNLIGIINKKLIPVILKEAGIEDIHMSTYALDYKSKTNIYNLLHAWDFKVINTNSFENAQVTLGGVNTKEVDSTSLQSKLVKGLYFGGEILDVDGDCGGFNLQWAWSSSSASIEHIYSILK